MNGAVILVTSARGHNRRAELTTYLDADGEERARDAAYHWIKGLRHLPVDGARMRERFMVRGDSLWWFTELYLHKLNAILEVHRAIAALQTVLEREEPHAIGVEHDTILVRHIVAAFADAHRLPLTGSRPRAIDWTLRLARLDARARMLNVAALMSRARSSRVPSSASGSPAVAAFVHRAFWRVHTEDGSAESYIGPVLRALEQRGASVRYVGVGPATNFRARRWWDPVLAPSAASLAVPIERFAPLRALSGSRAVWRARREGFQALVRSPSLREAAIIQGVDAWPVVQEQLAGVAWLQWPWSARAMDEAGAALDALSPASVLTYAEAGGWGRALILESRRRAIPSIGLQHGFIYRHWLNYLHEPDEMNPDGDRDRGFPRPTRTLLFDGYAATHLTENGRFPEGSLAITGSPQRDALVSAIGGFSPAALSKTRVEVGASPDELIVLVATKEREARAVLPALVAAINGIQGARLVIKPHPAETVAAYLPHVGQAAKVTIVPPAFPLAALLAVSRAIVTVNSTVALDAAVIGIPSLVLGLPNNLSPLVEAGVFAGAPSTAGVGPALERILYDESFRQQLANRQKAALDAHPAGRAGDAAARSASAILDLVEHHPERHS